MRRFPLKRHYKYSNDAYIELPSLVSPHVVNKIMMCVDGLRYRFGPLHWLSRKNHAISVTVTKPRGESVHFRLNTGETTIPDDPRRWSYVWSQVQTPSGIWKDSQITSSSAALLAELLDRNGFDLSKPLYARLTSRAR